MRVVIAEDLALLRDGLIRLLRIAASRWPPRSATVPSLVEALEAERPDVAVVDVRLPPSFTRRGAARRPRGATPRAGRPGARALPVRRAGLCDGAARGRRRRDRLPAQGPRRGHLGVRRRGASCGSGGTAMDPEVVTQLLVRRAPDRSTSSRRASVKYSVSSPRGDRMPASPQRSSSPSEQSRSTSRASSTSCISRRMRATTAGSSLCSRT